MSNSPAGFEIERKYLIRFPDLTVLEATADKSYISQTYLIGTNGMSERVRKRGKDGDWHFYHTAKKLVSGFTRIEIENEISGTEYGRLLERADPERRAIEKTRYCLNYCGQLFEIDVFPFWTDRAVMEVELPSEDTNVCLPPQFCVIKEVTGDKRYNNSSLARSVVTEDIEKEENR